MKKNQFKIKYDSLFVFLYTCFFCNIKIKIKKGEDFEKFKNIVEEYIKN